MIWRRVIFGELLNIDHEPPYKILKYPEETVLLLVYTTRQRNFALYITGVIFTCKCFNFGLNATGLRQSHFRNLSACSIRNVIVIYQLVNWSSLL